MISVVIPIHNEEGNILPLYEEITRVMNDLKKEYEIVYVNDGSTDRSLEILLELKRKDPRVRVINMDRNRGEAAALSAGFHFAKGDIIVTLDGDGQNDPAYIPELLKKLDEGYKAVSGWRKNRKESFIKRILPSLIANKLIALITGVNVHDNGCGLKAYRADIVKGIQIPHGFHRFMPAIFGVKNHEVAEVRVVDRPRFSGSSHYGLSRTLEVLRELLTIPFVLREPSKWMFCVKALFTYSVSLFLLSLILSIWFPEIAIFTGITGILSLVIWVIKSNLNRFVLAQREGVFKAEEL